MSTAASAAASAVLGQGVARVDGPAKVTGRAAYATDHLPARTVHLALVTATIAHGTITALDTAAAAAVPGVRLLLSHQPGQRPPLHPVTTAGDLSSGVKTHERLVPLQTAQVYYVGQLVAAVAADTPEAAQYAASLVAVRYAPQPPATGLIDQLPAARHQPILKNEPTDQTFGDPDAALAAAAQQLDAYYTTPAAHHAAMELHGLVAEWQGEQLTVHEPSQWVGGAGRALAEALGLAAGQVHVVSPFVGGAFGGKAYFRYHAALCAHAARLLGCPVKLVLTRKQAFVLGSGRPATRQRIRLGADAAGHLQAVVHDTWSATSVVDDYQETCGYATRQHYATPSLRTTHRMVPLHIGTPCPMRAPGEAPGHFALESALDELAHQLGLDPIELRLRNYADAEPGTGRPFSAKHLRACYALGAARIDWARRPTQPGTWRDGAWRRGLGMASVVFHVAQFATRAAVTLHADGTAEVASAAHDLGTGTYTVVSQLAATHLGVPLAQVRCRLGDNRLPPAAVAAGQGTTNSLGPAVVQAATRLRQRLAALASADPASPLVGVPPAAIGAANGRLFALADPARGEAYATLLPRLGPAELREEAAFEPVAAARTHSLQNWGAQFAEVAVHARTGEVRVRRLVGAFDFGRVLNPRLAQSQLRGGLVFGLGMALSEAVLYDPSSGHPVNANLGEYLVPVQADIPPIELVLLDKPDYVVSPGLGAKGCGEIGNTGTAAALANAVFNATGQRVRDLPITADKLLAAPDA